MKHRQFNLSEEAIRVIEERERETREALELRRLQGVRMYGSGLSMTLIEEITGAARRTVADWVKAYQKEGVEGLKPGWKGGNHRKLSGEKRVELGQRLQQMTPRQALSRQTHLQTAQFWTVETVAAAIEQWYGVRYRSRESYRLVLIEAGFSFQQPEGIYRSRPNEAVIADFEAEAEKKLTDFKQDHPQGIIVTMDEMSLYLQATTQRVWYPVGQHPIVRVSPERDCQHWYGALCLESGQEVALSVPGLDSQITLHFLTHLLTVFPTQPILLFLDRATWHRGEAIPAFLTQHPRLEFIYFPPACPQLNPQEHVWKAARQAVSHNHTFLELGSLRHAFAQFLDNTLFHFHWLEKFTPLHIGGV